MTGQVRLGRATLSRVVEVRAQMRTSLFGQTPAAAWPANADLLEPLFWDRGADEWKIAIQTWVIRVDGLTVLVDTGVGNHRNRPHMPPLHQLDTPYLKALTDAGVSPEDVDVVVNTHLHTDHVGWNTRLSAASGAGTGGGAWTPTFPNARYLMPELDYRHFSPDNPDVADGMRIVFADSVSPVEPQMELFSGDHRVSDSLWLRPAPGHTPGSTVVWLDAGVPAVFVGDLTHSPIQIPRPDDPCAFDVDPMAAARSRQRILTEASRRRAAVIPAHYPGRGGATVVARGNTFLVDQWLGFPEI
ncbi:MBL fold metallo-hydrolase [Mycolicibacterium austroafricanum]|uniref:MBL fold metallo-hydrolase n=1 Tax=Mycolicibacterium austroafricanum TaxID=39687 RepID=A0ABT8HF56_MYCAO|nr:MBL fold metallo-hydrolase [Mycolicibacterium austroafricanum]MDN4519402.1 MBL fold metallo-hydrolase [Mycolicibacterium austroafricanum]